LSGKVGKVSDVDDWGIRETEVLTQIPGLVESVPQAREEGPAAGSEELEW